MNSPEQTIKTWTVVGWIFAAIYFMLSLWYHSQTTPISGGMCVGMLIIAVLFVIGSLLARSRIFGGAFGCYLAGGILGFPLGLVMIIAAVKVRKAGAVLQAPPPPPVPSQ